MGFTFEMPAARPCSSSSSNSSSSSDTLTAHRICICSGPAWGVHAQGLATDRLGGGAAAAAAAPGDMLQSSAGAIVETTSFRSIMHAFTLHSLSCCLHIYTISPIVLAAAV